MIEFAFGRDRATISGSTDARPVLQLLLAAIWLMDGLLQCRSFMYTQLGLGIAYRPTVRLALVASVAWSLAVWWFGEDLGGVLAHQGLTASIVLAVALIAIAGPRARRPQTDGPPAMAFDLPEEKFE